MKQVAQRPRDGVISVLEVPLPVLKPGYVLVATRFSLISAGTERSKVELGRKSLLQKARSRPDLARKVVDRARVEGVRSALEAAREKLGALVPLGYSAAGVVVRVGHGVEGIAPGDRVACGGTWANHAEVLSVPQNLLAKVAARVDLADAAYATVGSIALHGVRQAEAAVGEHVGVIGLGLVGQLAMRLLGAAGCRAIGVDLDSAAVELARAGGADAFLRDDAALESAVEAVTGGLGLDAVLVCAATRSTDPLELAARLARDRGRLVVVGDVPVTAPRSLLYDKELELRLSRSYGPGRYDREYEERGRDLPAGYVRWTEQRNMQAFLDLLRDARVDLSGLTTHRFPVDRAGEAYALLAAPPDDGARPFGILIEYSWDEAQAPIALAPARPRPGTGQPRIALVGAGSFARGTLIPALKAAGADLAVVASDGGLSAADVASRFGFDRAVASADEILADDGIDAVIIATRHSTHAALAAAALRSGKAVFVEKPLGLTELELLDVEDALRGGGILMVGFNRRYAPLTERVRALLASAPAPVVVARVNAGSLPGDHWLHDPQDGGGRLVGEGCHFVDLLAHLSGSRVSSVHAVAAEQPGRAIESRDDLVATLRFSGGGIGALVYTGSGDPKLPKERIEAFAGGTAAVIDDFRRLELVSRGKRRVTKGAQDKGHRAQVMHFVRAVSGEAEPPSAQSYLDSSRATLALVESLLTGLPVEVL